nr:hypothetical protein [Pandoraea apista]
MIKEGIPPDHPFATVEEVSMSNTDVQRRTVAVGQRIRSAEAELREGEIAVGVSKRKQHIQTAVLKAVSGTQGQLGRAELIQHPLCGFGRRAGSSLLCCAERVAGERNVQRTPFALDTLLVGSVLFFVL